MDKVKVIQQGVPPHHCLATEAATRDVPSLHRQGEGLLIIIQQEVIKIDTQSTRGTLTFCHRHNMVYVSMVIIAQEQAVNKRLLLHVSCIH